MDAFECQVRCHQKGHVGSACACGLQALGPLLLFIRPTDASGWRAVGPRDRCGRDTRGHQPGRSDSCPCRHVLHARPAWLAEERAAARRRFYRRVAQSTHNPPIQKIREIAMTGPLLKTRKIQLGDLPAQYELFLTAAKFTRGAPAT